MPTDLPLHPDVRNLYGASLRPPPGTVFDAGVATSFSLDFETALAIPVTLALFASENQDELLQSPLALLEGLERAADRLVLFCEAGRIQAQPAPQSRLCTLLERLIVEVNAPRGGSFHPKLWILRYRSHDADAPHLMRLLVLSRNLTRDRSWDVALCLDGHVVGGRKTLNRPFVNLLGHLPSWATSTLPENANQLVSDLQADLYRTEWELPEPFDTVSFALNGVGRRSWKPENCTKLGIISPFCDTNTLAWLADLARENPRLVSRPEELIGVKDDVLGRFAEISVLDELAETGDDDCDDSDDVAMRPLSGLHAKVFVQETGRHTAITVGSGNATRPALLTQKNVEVFATLGGRRSSVGRIDEIFGQEGFGRVLRPFRQAEVSEVDANLRKAERRVELARKELVNANLTLRCTPEQDERTGEKLWKVLLRPEQAIRLEGLVAATAWPITLGEPHARDALTALRAGDAVEIATLPLVDVTRFLGFRLMDATHREAQALFALGFELDGLPKNRHQAVFRWVLNSRDAFLRYLRLLLADMEDPLSAQLAAASTNGGSNWGVAAEESPILEDLVRALSGGGDRLSAVRRLMMRLEQVTEDKGEAVVPADFMELWNAFSAVLDKRDRSRG